MAAPRMIKAGEVRRAQVILRLVAGQSYRTIMKQDDMHPLKDPQIKGSMTSFKLLSR